MIDREILLKQKNLYWDYCESKKFYEIASERNDGSKISSKIIATRYDHYIKTKRALDAFLAKPHKILR